LTVAGKINALVIAIAAAAGCLLSAHTLQSEYRNSLDRIIEQAATAVASQPQLQLDIYYRDIGALDRLLEGFTNSSPAINYAIIHDPAGATLARKGRSANAPLLSDIRGNASPSDQVLTSQTTDQGVAEYLYVLTVPVLSLVNPLEKNVSRATFGAALATPTEAASLHVVGYVQLGISRLQLLRGTLPAAALTAGLSLLFVLLCAAVSIFLTRRITAPFSLLVRVADDIAAGKLDQSTRLEGGGELKEIFALLNTIIGDISSYKTQMDVDHQLLSMKVEERTVQLSRRNEELNKAVREVTETKDRLRQLAYYDSLTSLPNRRLFTEQLDLLLRLAKRNKEMLALLFLDLDNFKRINDSLGHSAGDLLLREVGKRLTACVRDSDVVAHYVESNARIDVSRLGGDEFTVVLNQLDSTESAGVVARRLISALIKPMIIDGHELVVTPSIGIAVAPQDAENVEELLKSADTAMYHAKSSGKNNFLFYNSGMDAAGVERLTLETDLRKALERNELVLYYQPQVDTLTGSVVGAEALMRWAHPEQGLIPPFKFIPLAEEMGLIRALGEWGLQEACRQMIEFQGMGLDLPKVSVNVSALQFNKSFIARVGEVLHETALKPSRLELELTEGIMMDDTDATINSLEELKEMGVSLSIDDFGTGYSSLSYLSRFPLDELKIDRSFVVDYDKSRNDSSLIIAIIAMGRSMNLQLVAEGVETDGQYHFLRQHGAHIIQGYLFSPPVPAGELAPMLSPGYFRERISQIGAG